MTFDIELKKKRKEWVSCIKINTLFLFAVKKNKVHTHNGLKGITRII